MSFFFSLLRIWFVSKVVLDFYRTGKILPPAGITYAMIKAEFDFFQISTDGKLVLLDVDDLDPTTKFGNAREEREKTEREKGNASNTDPSIYNNRSSFLLSVLLSIFSRLLFSSSLSSLFCEKDEEDAKQ